MALRQVRQRFRHFWQKFHGMLGDLVGNTADSFLQLRRDRLYGESLEADPQRVSEAVHAITVLPNVLALDFVKCVANFVRRVLMVIQKGDEIGDRPLEVDVVLPERVIGVDEQVLVGQDLFRANGRHGFYPTETRSRMESQEQTWPPQNK